MVGYQDEADKLFHKLRHRIVLIPECLVTSYEVRRQVACRHL